MLRIFSSALGDRCKKLSQAAKRMADDDVEPGRNTDTEDAASRSMRFNCDEKHASKLTRNLLNEVTNVLPYNAGPVGLCDDERSAKIQVAFDTVAVSITRIHVHERRSRTVAFLPPSHFVMVEQVIQDRSKSPRLHHCRTIPLD
jgi:hypothetical protein